jgi:hypothetical protein
VFGVFGILASIAMFFVADTSRNSAIRIMHENPAYSGWLKLTIPLGALSCLVLLVSGIGLLGLRPWARKTSVIYAIYALLFGVVNLAMSFAFLMRPLLAEAAQKQGPEAAGAIRGAIGGVIGGVLGMVYPVLLLIFMTRPSVLEAFAPAQPPELPVAA